MGGGEHTVERTLLQGDRFGFECREAVLTIVDREPQAVGLGGVRQVERSDLRRKPLRADLLEARWAISREL